MRLQELILHKVVHHRSHILKDKYFQVELSRCCYIIFRLDEFSGKHISFDKEKNYLRFSTKLHAKQTHLLLAEIHSVKFLRTFPLTCIICTTRLVSSRKAIADEVVKELAPLCSPLMTRPSRRY